MGIRMSNEIEISNEKAEEKWEFGIAQMMRMSIGIEISNENVKEAEMSNEIEMCNKIEISNDNADEQ